MTPSEAINTIEGHRYSALTNLASNLKTFLRIAAQQPEVEALARAMTNDPAAIAEIYRRALTLSALPADGRPLAPRVRGPRWPGRGRCS